MALTKARCIAFSSPITWFVNNEGQFILKILDAGEKARKVREGYILHLAKQSETSFQLIDKINVGGKMTDVVYQFQKLINKKIRYEKISIVAMATILVVGSMFTSCEAVKNTNKTQRGARNWSS